MSGPGRVLVVDVGTSSVRAAVVDRDARLVVEHRRPLLPGSPAPGLVELDGAATAAAVLDLARAALDEAGPVDAVGIAAQRASTLVWDRATGDPVAPGIGWQDLRTVGRCLELRPDLVLTPNQSATKLEAILDQVDRDRRADLCFGTVDTWVAWTLSAGRLHVTDASNAAVTGLRTGSNDGWAAPTLSRLRIPERMLPAVVDSTGVLGPAAALAGQPPIAGLLGDQQASLLGQGCVRPGDAKITFGTGGMLDVVVGDRPRFDRGRAGTFVIVTRRATGRDTWGLEAIMLAAGTSVEWLRDGLALIPDPAASDDLARQCADTGDVWFVPALLGLGTPDWDHGARGALLGVTRGTTRAEIVRAVLEGVAHRGADLVDAATVDAGRPIGTLRVDGGMSANPTFVQALADATQRPVEISPVREATALGAAFAAGLAVGVWPDDDTVAATWAPAARVDPARVLDRERWRDARARAAAWIPELSAIDL